MSKNYAIEAEQREQAGKGAARSLRREGKIPAVIYGDKKEPVKITLDSNRINVEYYKGHMFTTLCDLSVGKDKHLVLARDVQLHPVTDVVEHVDFLRVSAKTKIAVNVPVTFVNEDKSPGLVDKGILNVTRYDVEVVCLATNIPDEIVVDLEGKEQGDAVKSTDAKLPEGSKFVIDDRDFTIATIVAPKRLEDLEAELAEGDEDDGIVSDEEAAAAAEAESGDAKEGDAE
ncbi:MAG: 50S ribosomal protein L25/general stress protein Ctc [Micavibrio sp.]|nr:50S ribosomal protein L25/general stress protein Ctc [Micavibrio sp.]|tara:strand:- start:1630 stop:2319 length:690 start_codon:yes stop_codon:yes gene_type:complete